MIAREIMSKGTEKVTKRQPKEYENLRLRNRENVRDEIVRMHAVVDFISRAKKKTETEAKRRNAIPRDVPYIAEVRAAIVQS